MTFASDFRINFDLGFDKSIRCHSNVDFAISKTGDILLTEDEAESILQRLFFWMSLKYGEVPGQPTLGCCIYKYFYKKATPNTFALMRNEIKTDLNRLIPGLNVTSVTVTGKSGDVGRIDGVDVKVTTARHGEIQLEVNQDDADKTLVDNLIGPMMDFSRAGNSQYIPSGDW